VINQYIAKGNPTLVCHNRDEKYERGVDKLSSSADCAGSGRVSISGSMDSPWSALNNNPRHARQRRASITRKSGEPPRYGYRARNTHVVLLRTSTWELLVDWSAPIAYQGSSYKLSACGTVGGSTGPLPEPRILYALTVRSDVFGAADSYKASASPHLCIEETTSALPLSLQLLHQPHLTCSLLSLLHTLLSSLSAPVQRTLLSLFSLYTSIAQTLLFP
jgi:hypothetical protein